MAVLIVDDEPGMRDLLRGFVERAGGRATTVARLVEARAALDVGHFDVVAADRMLPDGDGLWDFLLTVQRDRLARVGLSAFYDGVTQVAVQEVGAVVLAKPFRGPTFVRAVLEACRRANVGTHRFLRFDPFLFDAEACVLHGPVDLAGRSERKPIVLSTGECKVLTCLLQHKGERVPPEQLAREAFQRTDRHARALVAQYVRCLRKKLPADWRHLVTVGKGRGYHIDEVRVFR